MDLMRNINGKLLRCGYTTGSCAAAASKAAAIALLTGEAPAAVELMTPKGIGLTIDVVSTTRTEQGATCAVRKDSGDDPDVTNGILIYASVAKTAAGISIDGGTGVGRVTKPGLDQPVGNAAINSTPRRMIREALEQVSRKAGYEGGLDVVISIPEGEALAMKTFNPRMGIVGGISVIGTSGIVEPMSNQALIDTIRLELRQLREAGFDRVLLTPGNYGETFARDELGLRLDAHENCSNFIGSAVDACVEFGFTEILLVGHIGKLVKLGIGIPNTHSQFGDGRMETLTACALEAGGSLALLKNIMNCVTTDAALSCLRQEGLTEQTMAILGRRIEAVLERRVPMGRRIGFVCFTNTPAEVLCRSENAEELLEFWRK